MMGVREVLLLASLLLAVATAVEVHTTTFRSPPIKLTPGAVFKKQSLSLEMPSGHVGIRSFTAQVMSEDGPVPLSEVYVHHWIGKFIELPAREATEVIAKSSLHGLESQTLASRWFGRGDDLADEKFKQRLEVVRKEIGAIMGMPEKVGDATSDSNVCGLATGQKWFGIGAETRLTYQGWRAPYGMEINGPEVQEKGRVEEFWSEIHVIDTRHAVKAKSCVECLCESYGAPTVDELGRPIPEGYLGGILCCYDGGHCETEGGEGEEKIVWLEYTIGWVQWTPCVVPVKTFYLDVTPCDVEYDVSGCSERGPLSSCVDERVRSVRFTESGNIVFAAGHQHIGGTGINVLKDSNTVLCASAPSYGGGSLPGDEAGYLVRMGMCWPDAHTSRIQKGTELTVVSRYSKFGEGHTGVMGLFYVAFAADKDAPAEETCAEYLRDQAQAKKWRDGKLTVFGRPRELTHHIVVGAYGGIVLGLVVAVTVTVAIVLLSRRRGEVTQREVGYASLLNSA